MKLLEMKMRPGVKSLTNEHTDEEFFSLIEPIVLVHVVNLKMGLEN
jgi:hypothetical protein